MQSTTETTPVVAETVQEQQTNAERVPESSDYSDSSDSSESAFEIPYNTHLPPYREMETQANPDLRNILTIDYRRPLRKLTTGKQRYDLLRNEAFNVWIEFDDNVVRKFYQMLLDGEPEMVEDNLAIRVLLNSLKDLEPDTPFYNALRDALDCINLIHGEWALTDDTLRLILRDPLRRPFITYTRQPFWTDFTLLNLMPRHQALVLATIRAYQLEIAEHHKAAMTLCQYIIRVLDIPHYTVFAIRSRAVNEQARTNHGIWYKYESEDWVETDSDPFTLNLYLSRADFADLALESPFWVITRADLTPRPGDLDERIQWAKPSDLDDATYTTPFFDFLNPDGSDDDSSSESSSSDDDDSIELSDD